jgi:hypothetical protein
MAFVLSGALEEAVTLDAGRVPRSNFNTYRLLRLNGKSFSGNPEDPQMTPAADRQFLQTPLYNATYVYII